MHRALFALERERDVAAGGARTVLRDGVDASAAPLDAVATTDERELLRGAIETFEG